LRQAHLKQNERTLPEKQRYRLLRDLLPAPAWMHPIIHDLSEMKSLKQISSIALLTNIHC